VVTTVDIILSPNLALLSSSLGKLGKPKYQGLEEITTANFGILNKVYLMDKRNRSPLVQ
jgi:hypothetical protein